MSVAKPLLPQQFYLTGTDTGVGKTTVSALLCAAIGFDYWKPVQAGLDDETDSEKVARLAGCTVHGERYRLKRAASPHAAAADEGITMAPTDFRLPTAKPLLVEGAGGYCVPYGSGPMFWQGDLMQALGLPVVVVARSGLGTLNHSLLTLRALRADGHRLAGLVLVGDEHRENRRDIEAMGDVAVLARVPWFEPTDAAFRRIVQNLRKELQP